ncbi:uncharacterized protein TNCV_3052821 [Trichonephila clavipes]|nr:uncharacterized protein TNCV_3052821 [Trichonephila clavipes]
MLKSTNVEVLPYKSVVSYPSQDLLAASKGREGVQGRNRRCTSGVYTPVCVRVVHPFSKSKESVSDNPRSGTLATSVSDENIEKERKLITKDRLLTVELHINRETVSQIVILNLRIKKRVIEIDDIHNIERNVTKLLNSISKEDFLKSFQDMYSRSLGYIVMEGDYFERMTVAWWLENRTPDRKAWARCPIPPNTLRVRTEYMLVKSVGPKVLWAESRVQGTGEYFPFIQFHAKIVEVEIGGVAIYHPFGEFHLDNSYCHLYDAQGLGQRQAYF